MPRDFKSSDLTALRRPLLVDQLGSESWLGTLTNVVTTRSWDMFPLESGRSGRMATYPTRC